MAAARGRGREDVRYWTHAPAITSEILLEDVATGEVVGWDAELNIPGDVARTMAVPQPTTPHSARRTGVLARRLFELQLLCNREWVLRAAPLKGLPDASQRVAFIRCRRLSPRAPQPLLRRWRRARAVVWMLDVSTGLLYWRDDVVRVRPFARPLGGVAPAAPLRRRLPALVVGRAPPRRHGRRVGAPRRLGGAR